MIRKMLQNMFESFYESNKNLSVLYIDFLNSDIIENIFT